MDLLWLYFRAHCCGVCELDQGLYSLLSQDIKKKEVGQK